MEKIGLKYLPNKVKGRNIRGKIRGIYWEMKYAFQRAWKGYDNVEVFAFNDVFVERTIAILKRYKKTKHCVWNVPVDSKYYEELGNKDVMCGRVFSEKDTNTIIDTMIFHLKMIDEDYVEKILYGNNVYDEGWKSKSFEECLRIYNVQKQNKELFFKLFELFFFDLWD